MSQNTSSAVMAQRREPDDSLDYFPTPPWAVRALMVQLDALGLGPFMHALEPACGEGHMAKALSEWFPVVEASDVHPYGYGYVEDFLFPGAPKRPLDWIITNPPFRLAADFIAEARRRAGRGVAMLARTAFMEGQERFDTLWAADPPDYVLIFSERVLMLKGRLLRIGAIDPKSGKPAATATSYAWFVWSRPARFENGNLVRDGAPADPRLRWIPPCRDRLERSEDYAPERDIPPIPLDKIGLFARAAE